MIEVSVNRNIPLRDVRVQLLLSQKELSKRSGISIPTIISAEYGGPIRALTAQALLDALNAVRSQKGLPPLARADLNWNAQGD